MMIRGFGLRIIFALILLYAPSLFAWKVVVDPGHGGKDPGALSTDGQVYEKDMTLLFAKELAAELGRYDNISVFLTRTEDRFLSLPQRQDFLREVSADLFLSIHMDQGDESYYRGFTLYTQSNASARRTLRQKDALYQELALPASLKNDPSFSDALMAFVTMHSVPSSKNLAAQLIDNTEDIIFWHNKRVVPRDLFVLHRPIPNLLIEIGFVSNEEDLRSMQNAGFRKKVVVHFAKTVSSFLQNL